MLCAVSARTWNKMSVQWRDHHVIPEKQARIPDLLIYWCGVWCWLNPRSLSCQLGNRLYSIVVCLPLEKEDSGIRCVMWTAEAILLLWLGTQRPAIRAVCSWLTDAQVPRQWAANQVSDQCCGSKPTEPPQC